MTARQLRRIVEDKYTAYAQKVVEEIKAIGPESLTAPADLGLTDVREEFKSRANRVYCIEATDDFARLALAFIECA